MKQRNIFKMLLLMFVTFGIYNLYWLKSTRDEMVAKGAKIPSFWLLFAPLLILLVALAIAFAGRAASATPNQQSSNTGIIAQVEDLPPDTSTSDYTALDSELTDEPLPDESSSVARLGTNLAVVVLGLVGVISSIVIPLYWYYKYCHGVEMATHGHTSSGTAYLLFIVLSLFFVGFVWPLIIQDSFNKVASTGPGSYGPHGQPQPPTSYTHY